MKTRYVPRKLERVLGEVFQKIWKGCEGRYDQRAGADVKGSVQRRLDGV
jgi:hypothetical protein